MNTIQVQRSPNLTDQVTQALRLDLISHPEGPGAPLPSEQAMASGYGVSRTVMREAISRLKAEGLVVTRQGIGAFVGSSSQIRPFRIDAIDVADASAVLKVVELRSGFEIEATGLAALRRTRDHLRILQDSLKQMARAVGESNVKAGAAADLSFHREVYAATGNEYFVKFFDFISQFYREGVELSRQHSAQDKARETQAHQEHAAVYDAIRRQDVEGARQAARVLLQNTASRIVAMPS